MFSNDKNIETIGQLVEVVRHYIGLQSEYVRLDIVDKIVKLFTVLIMATVIGILLLTALIYLSFAAAFALSTIIGQAEAFCIVGVFYVLLLLLCITYRHQWIEKPLVQFLASFLLSK